MWLLTTGHLSTQRLNRESRHIDEFGLKNRIKNGFLIFFYKNDKIVAIQWKVRPPSPDDQLIKYAIEKPTKRQQLSKNIIILIMSFVYVFGEYHFQINISFLQEP